MFGNNASDGYHAQSYRYEPKWEKLIDYNPDHAPSSSRFVLENTGPDGETVRCLMEIRGLGVVVMRMAVNSGGTALEFQGLSEFTDQEIGWRT